jgi:predicted MFS family arabinose efflux permease
VPWPPENDIVHCATGRTATGATGAGGAVGAGGATGASGATGAAGTTGAAAGGAALSRLGFERLSWAGAAFAAAALVLLWATTRPARTAST